MKKVLLSAMALVAAMSVNAQVEIGVIDADAIGINSDAATEKEAGTEIIKTASVTGTVLFKDNFKATGLAKNNVKVSGEDLGSTTGIQGSTNPSPNGVNSGNDFPSQGCVYHFEVSKDGYLYVIHKSAANKNYLVWEEKARIPYIFSAQDGGNYDLAAIEGATEEVDGVTYVASDFVLANAQTLIGTEGLGAGTCVIKFPVYEGLAYDVHAAGSKITLAGIIFDETGDATITLEDDETNITLLNAGQLPGADPTGISNVKNVINLNGTIFNLAGQQVNENYKGVVIKNGQKSIQK